MEHSKSIQMEVMEKYSHGKGWGHRHLQCLILFLALTTAYSMRACMGVSVVAMTDHGALVDDADTNNSNASDAVNNTTADISIDASELLATVSINKEDIQEEGILHALLLVPPYPRFTWNKQLQDTVLSSFFWGYMVLQLPGGQLAHRFGCRRLLTGALAINCFLSCILPWATLYGGWTCTAIIRLLQGLSQACVVPALHGLLGRWVPLQERARLAGFVMSGHALGTVFGLTMTGLIASSPLGWPGIFRFYGVSAGLMSVLVYCTVADSPGQHPSISHAERRYIEDALKQKQTKKPLPVPWKKILMSRGMLAITAAHVGQTWGQLTLFTEVPAFMKNVMGVNIKANGLLTALPFLAMWFTNFFFSWLTDALIVRNIASPTSARKIANSLGSVPAAIGLCALGFVPSDMVVVETILVLVCCFKVAANVGFMVNHIDISPNFAATMMSIGNFVANTVGSQAPLVAGLLLDDVTSTSSWRRVFSVSAALYFTSNLVYVWLGTAERAAWDEPHRDEQHPREKNPMIV